MSSSSKERLLASEYALFRELYAHMTGLYQVMKNSHPIAPAPLDAAAATASSPSPTGSLRTAHPPATAANHPTDTTHKSANNNSSQQHFRTRTLDDDPLLSPQGSLVLSQSKLVGTPQSNSAVRATRSYSIIDATRTRKSHHNEVGPSTSPSVGRSLSLHQDLTDDLTEVGRHYFLVLPSDQQLKSFISHLRMDAKGPGEGSPMGPSSWMGSSRSLSESMVGAPPMEDRVRHNVVRSHVFQSSAGVRNRTEPLALVGLTGFDASLTLEDGEDEAVGSRPIGTIRVSSSNPAVADTVNGCIAIFRVLMLGNLTVLFSDVPVLRPLPPPRVSELAAASPPRASQNGSAAARGSHPVWWQRLPLSALAKLKEMHAQGLLVAPVTGISSGPDPRRGSSPSPLPSPSAGNLSNTTSSATATDAVIASTFRADERELQAILSDALEPRGMHVDDSFTAVDTEVCMLNSSYMILPGFEQFLVSKLDTIVESAMDTLVDLGNPISTLRLESEDEEEQVMVVLHCVLLAGVAQKLNDHWASQHHVEDFAFHHACASLRRNLTVATFHAFLPAACAKTITVADFSIATALCRVTDNSEVSVFSMLRAMEGVITAIVDVIAAHSEKRQDVTADVCIPVVVLVLMLAAPEFLPSRIKLLLLHISPALELSSLGYALTTFEAAVEQIHYEYANFVKNR